MRAKGLLSVVMTGAMMMGVMSGCGFKPDITWTDTADGSESSYKVTVVVAHDGKLSIDSEQTVKDGDTLNFIATPSKDGDHRITGLMVDGVKRTDYTGELPLEGEVKISLENINQDMTVVVLCDNETGGLGGVDGVVTGLDGSDSNDDSDSTPAVDVEPENVNVTIGGTGSGTVYVNGSGFTYSGSAEVPYDQKVTIRVEPGTYSKVASATVGGASMKENLDGSYTYTIEKITGDTTVNVTFSKVELEMKGTIDKTYYLYDGGKFSLSDINGLSVKIKDTNTYVTNDGTFEIVSPIGSFTKDNISTDPTVTVQWTSKDGSISCTGTFNVTVYAMTSDAASKLEGEFTTKYLDQFNAGRKDDKWDQAGIAGSDITEAMDAIDYNGTYDTGNVQVDDWGLNDHYKFIRKTVIVTSQDEAEKAFEAFYNEIVGPAIDGADAQKWYQGAYVFIDLDSTTGECTMGVVYDGFYGI